MLNQVEVRTSTGALLTLSLDDVVNGYIVTDINGLGPVKASIASASVPNLRGSQRQSSRTDNRNITMTIKLEPDYVDTFDVGALRDNLYGYFMPESDVELRFYDSNGRIVKISGEVEDCAPSIFTDSPAVDISIINFDPDFTTIDPVTTSFTTSNSTTDPAGLLTINYPPNMVSTGVVFTLHVNRTLTEFTIYNRGPDGLLRTMDFSASLVSGDVVTISTVRGAKEVTLNRGGTLSSLLYAMSSQSINWVELVRGGDNLIRFYATGAAIPFDLTYTPRYGGL